jgi:hypothetical protein
MGEGWEQVVREGFCVDTGSNHVKDKDLTPMTYFIMAKQ